MKPAIPAEKSIYGDIIVAKEHLKKQTRKKNIVNEQYYRYNRK